MVSTPFLPSPPRDYGGTELVVAELTEGLVALGHECTLFATGDSHSSANLRWRFREAQWPPDNLHDLTHVSWALDQIAAGDYDLVHVHSALGLAMARLVPDLPMFYTIHHERDQHLSEFYQHFPEAHYIAISQDQRAREVPLRHSHVIHHGLDPAPFQLTGTPEDYVCFIGRLSRIKGPEVAIDVARAAGLPIRVAGEIHAPDREFADREVLPRLEQEHVTWLDSIGMEKKVTLLRDARALLVPIDWNEPFGLVMIEAMLSGCPVVAFNRGSVAELVETGITGFTADGPGAMAELIRSGGPLEQFDRERCRARAVERFSRMRMATDHERLYRRVLSQRPGSRAGPVRVA